jgi:hypothetical protein
MAKKRKSTIRALPPSTAPPPAVVRHKPVTETVVIRTEQTREKKRQASGGSLDGKLLPMIAGVAGGAATVYATSKLNWHPVAVAGAGAAAGLAVAATSKTPWIRQAGMGAAIGAATLGGVQLVGSILQPSRPAPTVAQAPGGKKRGADGERDADGGDGFITRKELNDALGKLADSTKETQKQQTCDLLTALRDEIRKVIAEGPNGPGTPVPSPPKPKPTEPQVPFTYPFTQPARGADGDDYVRNAYGDDIRDAAADDYMRNAYSDDIRDAAVYEERDAGGWDERYAGGYEERDAGGYEERDAGGWDERDAGGWDERDASGYEERDAAPEEWPAAA